MFEGLLTGDNVKKFIAPLNDIISVGITEKVLINIFDDCIKISSTTQNKSNYFILKYNKEFLKEFTLPSVPFNFGVKDFTELVGIMRAFPEGFKIKIEDDVLYLISGQSTFTYYGCNEKHCITGPKKIDTETGLLSSFKWDTELNSFTKAISQLKTQDHVVFSGNKDDTVMTLMVTNEQFKRYHNFSSKVQSTSIKESFRKITDKKILLPVITSSVDEHIVKIFDDNIMFMGKTDAFSVIHMVSTKVK